MLEQYLQSLLDAVASSRRRDGQPRPGIAEQCERTVRIKDGVIASDEPKRRADPVLLPELQEAPQREKT